MKKTLFILSLVFLSCAQNLDREIPQENPKIQTSMNALLKEIEQDMLTLLEDGERQSPAFYYLDKTRSSLLRKMDSLSLLGGPDLLSQLLELDEAKRRLLQASSTANPVIRDLDVQIGELKKQME